MAKSVISVAQLENIGGKRWRRRKWHGGEKSAAYLAANNQPRRSGARQ